MEVAEEVLKHGGTAWWFTDDEACSNVLESGPWLFTGRMVILKKWHPRLILTKETYSKIPVWVKLFNIPHEY
ncbi:hypothetical protein Dsin_012456 [Dipteronia sinensis]|uniref:DUF4283 domain-containing protein n=1 Tax=Dipteronia sinensis TaxID=43782 RepID=A0AAE0AI29_9ROSI|nr:hypothetical protein Dsin_012456 [Dipteronia sinensis]